MASERTMCTMQYTSTMAKSESKKPPLGPDTWLSWLAVGLLWLMGRLPPQLGRWLVQPLGPLLYLLMGHRRRIAWRNIEKCFPELDTNVRQDIVRGTFNSLARMLIETAWCWSAPITTVAAMTRVEGLENLQDAEEAGRGVLVLTLHSTCMEMGGFMLGNRTRAVGIYRSLKNPVFEWYQNRGRGRYSTKLFKKDEIRSAVRELENGGVLWYAPDQDSGHEKSAFAAFFGIQTATQLAIHRLPALTGCAVVPMFPRFDKDSDRYVLTLLPALDNFPTENAVEDLTRINAILEAQVRRVPDQYWWIHKRFKTRPVGEAPFYHQS